MKAPLLRAKLEPIAARYRQMLFWRIALVVLAVTAFLGVAAYAAQKYAHWAGGEWVEPGLFLLAIAGLTVAHLRTRKIQPDLLWIARKVEAKHPDLNALLLAAVEEINRANGGELGYLQQRVIGEALDEGNRREWTEVVPTMHLFGLRMASTAAIVVLCLSVIGYKPPVAPKVAAIAKLAPGTVEVTPGDTSLEKGLALVVTARFGGQIPTDATLVAVNPNGERKTFKLTRSLDDPIFGGTIPEIAGDLHYHVEYGAKNTRDFAVKVFEFPRLEKTDVRITYPEYTGLKEKTIADTRRVSAVEGSTLDLKLMLNKPVRSARLLAKDGTALTLTTETNAGIAHLANFVLAETKAYDLQLIDSDGRTNKVPAQFTFDALKNRVPEFKIATPAGDQRVSPLEEVEFNAEVSDDFGVKAAGLAYSVNGKETKYLQLAKTSGPNEKLKLYHLLTLESLKLKPNELVSWFMWADDIGPDGKLRRSASDMFFAEVRPFDEIFRAAQGQEDDSSSDDEKQSGGSPAMKLAELQKQIIAATWKLQRETPAGKASAQYTKDVDVVQQSEESALTQAKGLESNAKTADVKATAKLVQDAMKEAISQLKAASTTTKPLPQALTAEQTAYQELLKLSAREFLVNKDKKGKGGQGQSEQMNRTLQNLDMADKDDRYETRKQAAPQKSKQQQEDQAILNRLQELARRQQDINDRLKELQNALQEAKTDAEKEEIKKKLKRLKEQETEVLADLDETKQKMQQGDNASRMAEQSKQLDKTRNDVQKAAEALENNSPSQALASGARAAKDLQKTRDDIRKQNASALSEEMKQLRSDAREVARNQQELDKKLEGMDQTKKKTLSDSGERKELANQLQAQRQKITNLVDRASELTSHAEQSEPLAAKALYDTVRKASQDNIDESLNQAAQLAQAGFVPQASEAGKKATKGVENLKHGIEKATESVLGDDAEALKLARKELDDLATQIQKEKEAMAGGDQPGNQPGKNAQGKPQPGQGKGQAKGQGQGQGQPGDKSAQANAAGEQSDDQKAQAEAQDGQGQGQQPGKQPGKGQGQQAKNEQGQGQGKGQQPGKQPGQGKGQGQQPGEQAQQEQQDSQQQAQAEGQGQGQGQGKGQGKGKGQPGQQQTAQAQQPQQNGQQPQPGQGQGEGQPQDPQQQQAQGQGNQGGQGRAPMKPGQRQRPQLARSQTGQIGSNPAMKTEGGGSLISDLTQEQAYNDEGARPLTGDDFQQWNERLRDVEEMVDDPRLREDLAKVREAARNMRAEVKRHGKNPQWPMVQSKIIEPMAEVRQRLSEELLKRESPDTLVPIDRDPVPARFSELVRKYYEKLGTDDRKQPPGGAQ